MKHAFRFTSTPPGVAALLLTPAVVSLRLPLLAVELGGGDPWRGETVRAAAEKVAAALEGTIAAQAVLASSFLAFWPEMLSGRVPSLVDGSALRLASNAALRPSARRVKANFKRLSAKA